MSRIVSILLFLFLSHWAVAQCDTTGVLLELQATTNLQGVIFGNDRCITTATILPPLEINGDTLSIDVSGLGGIDTVRATAPAAGMAISGSPITAPSGTLVFSLTNDLAALEGLSTTGIPARTGTDTWALRQIASGSGISVSNPDGVGGNPTITNSAPDQVVSITGAGITVITGTYPNFIATSTEVDGSTTNEVQTFTHSGTTSYTGTLSLGGGAFTLQSGTGISLSHTGGTTTITSSITQYTTENAQDDIGGILVDGTTIDFTYSDPTPSITAEVFNNSISDAKIRQSAGLSVIGRSANTTGNVADITAGTDAFVLRRSGTTLGFGQVATGGHADQSVTYVKMQNAVANNVLLGNNNGANTSFEELDAAAAQTMLGFIDGAGANQRIAYFTDANTLAAEAAFLYDAANDRQTITSTTPGLGAGAAILNLTNTGPDGTGEFLQIRGDISVNLLSGMTNTNTSATANTIWNVTQAGNSAGDPAIQMQVSGTGGNTTTLGVDNSDVNKFKITPNANAPGANANASLVATNDAIPLWGINKDAPGFVLDVGGRERSEQYIGINVAWGIGDVFFGLGAGTAPTFTSLTGTHNWVRLLFKTGTAPTANNNIVAIQRKANYQYAVKGFPTICAGNAATAGEITKFYVGGDNGINVNIIANGTLTASTDYELLISWSGY